MSIHRHLLFAGTGSLAPLCAPGGTTDVIARLSAEAFAKELSAQLPDTPTFLELAVKDDAPDLWNGLAAPAKLPGFPNISLE